MAISEAQAPVERELWEARIALAEARAFISRVVEDGSVSPLTLDAYRDWLKRHPFDAEAGIAALRLSAERQGFIDNGTEDTDGEQ